MLDFPGLHSLTVSKPATGGAMISTNLQGVAELVVRRAQRQGFVVPREVREVLSEAGMPESLWKDVLAAARPSLSCRHGRYYYAPQVSERVRAEQNNQRNVQLAVLDLMRHHRKAAEQVERRNEDRIDFIHPVKVITEDQRQLTFLSRDLSSTGIRLIGTRRLLGQKVRLLVETGTDGPTWSFLVRILWTCAIGDDLVENGGSFLEAIVLPPGQKAP
jgi:hypothetical protein